MKMKTTYQNLWDVAKAVLRRKFKSLNIRKDERSKINHLSSHLRKLEKEEQIKSKVSRGRKIIKNQHSNIDINEIENRKSTEKNQ